MADPEIRPADPGESGVRALILAQLEYGRAVSPPEDAHALEPEEFAGPGVELFAAREGEAVLAIGALVRIDDDHGELKAMHTAAAARGRGLGRAMLAHLLAEARGRGYRRVSLETGAMAAFAPARALYGSDAAVCFIRAWHGFRTPLGLE